MGLRTPGGSGVDCCEFSSGPGLPLRATAPVIWNGLGLLSHTVNLGVPCTACFCWGLGFAFYNGRKCSSRTTCETVWERLGGGRGAREEGEWGVEMKKPPLKYMAVCGEAGEGEMCTGQFNFMGPGWQEDGEVEASLMKPACP